MKLPSCNLDRPMSDFAHASAESRTGSRSHFLPRRCIIPRTEDRIVIDAPGLVEKSKGTIVPAENSLLASDDPGFYDRPTTEARPPGTQTPKRALKNRLQEIG